MSERPDPADVMRRIIESRLGDLHTAMPGTVESFDASTQCVDVRPALTRRIPGPDPDDADVFEQLPVLPCVPVLYPGTAAMGVRFALSKGDRGLLVFCEADIGRWQANGQDGNPQAPGAHPLNAGVFIPGDFSQAGKWASLPSNAVTIGGPGAGDFRVEVRADKVVAGGDSDAAALASKVDKIEGALREAATGTQDGGAAYKTNIIAALDLGGAWGTSASSRLKVDS